MIPCCQEFRIERWAFYGAIQEGLENVQRKEAYMEILNQRYIALLSNEELPASERFWKLQQAIQVDRHRPGVCLELRKQTMVYDLAALIEDRAITGEDLAEFSDEVKERVAMLLQQPLGE